MYSNLSHLRKKHWRRLRELNSGLYSISVGFSFFHPLHLQLWTCFFFYFLLTSPITFSFSFSVVVAKIVRHTFFNLSVHSFSLLANMASWHDVFVYVNYLVGCTFLFYSFLILLYFNFNLWTPLIPARCFSLTCLRFDMRCIE